MTARLALLGALLACGSTLPAALANDCSSSVCECDACCDDCQADSSCCHEGCPLFGFVLPSDRCFTDFISPMTNPVFFEDPRNLTEARFIYAHHVLPDDLGNGDLDIVALQLRAAITDRLSIIATKDGFIFAGSDAPLDDGWADVAAGLKYLLFADSECQRLLSTGLTFEIPGGSTQALQGTGDGEFNIFLTGGTQLGESSHWVSALGVRLPTNTSEESQMFYWSNHWDKQLGWNGWYALTELNWYHYLSSGDNGVPGIGGLDFFNFGSRGVAGEDVLTWAFGLKYKPTDLSELGIAFEIPVTEFKDVLENRLTFDAIIRY
jgi:hypothetical protein